MPLSLHLPLLPSVTFACLSASGLGEMRLTCDYHVSCGCVECGSYECEAFADCLEAQASSDLSCVVCVCARCVFRVKCEGASVQIVSGKQCDVIRVVCVRAACYM